MDGVVHAILICSDDGCTDEFEAWGTLEELEALACECGCALQVISVSAVDDERAPAHVVLERAA